MNSQRYQELLGRLLEGELSDAEAEELAAGLKDRPEMQRDLRSHLVLWKFWSQQHTPERSSDTFLNAWKTRLRVEREDADAFAAATRSRIDAPDRRTEIAINPDAAHAIPFRRRISGRNRGARGTGAPLRPRQRTTDSQWSH